MTEPARNIEELLAPLKQRESEVPLHRFRLDRQQIVSRMVDASLVPEPRLSRKVQWTLAVGLAAACALAAWGGISTSTGGGTVTNRGEIATSRVRVHARSGQVLLDGRPVLAGRDVAVPRDGVVQTGKEGSARIETDGMEVELLGNSRVSLNELRANQAAASVRLHSGRVRCVIPHEPGRVFSVVTDDARVIDIGTVFSVSVVPSADGSKTSVQVEEGEVLVEHAGRALKLRAPDAWSSLPEMVAAPVDSLPLETSEPTVPSSPRKEPSKRARDTLGAELQLLQAGLASEQRGELANAARSFAQLVKRYPTSPLAPDARTALARVKGRLRTAP